MKENSIKIKTPISYYGGKQNLVNVLLRMIPEHKIYCEPFFGGGALFFRKQPSYLEVINDINDNLINFYEQCQSNFEKLAAEIDSSLCSESLHRWARKVYEGELQVTAVKKALATWLVFNESFMCSARSGWRWDNGTDCSHIGIVLQHQRKNFCPWIKQRLARVQISCRDALTVISQRDTPGSFFYLDPPYPGTYQGHYAGYSMEELEKLLKVLETIHGQFLLSCYDIPILHDFATKNNWQLKLVHQRKSCVNKYREEYKTEALLFNYQIRSPIQTSLF